MEPLARILVVTGLVFVAVGLLLHFAPSVPFLGKLPGDVRIERPGLSIHVPITTCLLLSLVLSAVLWLVGKLR